MSIQTDCLDVRLPATAPAAIPAARFRDELLKDDAEPYRLSGARVTGDLDLRFRQVKRAVEIADCVFEGAVDARNARFEATAQFTGCHFLGAFNAGDAELSHATCAADLAFRRCRFAGAAWFRGIRCEGSGSFAECVFCAPADVVDLAGAAFGTYLEASRAIFHGGASFCALRCGTSAFFRAARFESTEHEPDFSAGSYGVSLELREAVFRCGTDFAGLSCGLRLALDQTRFESPRRLVSFRSVTAPYILACGALFHGPVSFEGLHCAKLASFNPLTVPLNAPPTTLVEGPVPEWLREAARAGGLPLPERLTMRRTDEEWRIEAADDPRLAVLRGTAANLVLSVPTRFVKGADFSHGRFDLTLELSEAVFDGGAAFNGVRCEGGAFLLGTRFTRRGNDGAVDFRFASFGINLQLNRAELGGPVDMESCTVGSDLVVEGAEFEGTLNLAGVRMRRLRVGAAVPFPAGRTCLRGCVFAEFHTDVAQADRDATPGWRALVDAQDPEHFSRDPYLVLEKFYRETGQQQEADDIYYAGRRDERRHARSPSAAVRWSPFAVFKDGASWVLTGYGVRMNWLFCWITFFVLLGVLVFWPAGALLPAEPEKEPAAASAVASPPAGGAPATAAAAAAGTVEPATPLRRFVHRLGYSLDELVPVDLRVSDAFRPAPGFRHAYNAFHVAAGWILIPLLVGAAGGLLGKK